eukprot:Clim_evm8s39 gene=Clim_evmTU8s39
MAPSTKRKAVSSILEVDDDSDGLDFPSIGFSKTRVTKAFKSAGNDDDDDDIDGGSAGGTLSQVKDTVAAQQQVRKQVQRANDSKEARKARKSGGFQTMGLSGPVLKAIAQKGYKLPTPIQRKAIPPILEGRDVVAMARTGSGKTAAFLLPFFERMIATSRMVGSGGGMAARNGIKGLILAPTRELALQSLKFVKELGKYVEMTSALIVGGDSMEDHFAVMRQKPNLVVATPGRFLHIVVEMDLDLSSVGYCVLDEADRLFEMGFAEQIQQILARIPEERQMCLFSATLPRMLVEFSQAGLHDPMLIRLDTETKLSDALQLHYFGVKRDSKIAALLWLLMEVIDSGKESTVVFVATKHHTELIRVLCENLGISTAYIYGSLDQTERKINIGKFRNGKARVLIVTDVAARGIDIPILDNVINFDFPAKPKLFVHRVGRVARAGRTGTAYSLVSNDEIPYLIDLHLFLGRPLLSTAREHSKVFKAGVVQTAKEHPGIYGLIPFDTLAAHEETWASQQETHYDISQLAKVVENAYKLYIKSRPVPSSESVKRAKRIIQETMDTIHPMIAEELTNPRKWADGNENGHGEGGEGTSASSVGILKMDNARESAQDLLSRMKSYRPSQTIFEANPRLAETSASAMERKRKRHDIKILEERKERAQKKKELDNDVRFTAYADRVSGLTEEVDDLNSNPLANDDDEEPGVVIDEHAYADNDNDDDTQQDANEPGNKKSYFIPYKPKEYEADRGYTLNEDGDFLGQMMNAELDLAGDENATLNRSKAQLKWDRKKKKYVKETGVSKNQMMRTESGMKIRKSVQTSRYADWLKQNRIKDEAGTSNGIDKTGTVTFGDDDDNGESEEGLRRRGGRKQKILMGSGRQFKHKAGVPKNDPSANASGGKSASGKKGGKLTSRGGLRHQQDIVKERTRKAREQEHLQSRREAKMAKRGGKGGGGKRSGRKKGSAPAMGRKKGGTSVPSFKRAGGGKKRR